MRYHLDMAERDELFNKLNDRQKAFLTDHVNRGRRTRFSIELAKMKGAVIPEDATFEEIERLVDSWVYVRYIDAGHVTNELKCECGRSLRYQHIVEHKQTGEVRRFGIEHLEVHSGIDAKTVALIVKGFDAIDLELSEILLKKGSGWSYQAIFPRLPAGFQLPAELQEQLDLGLPLLDRQVDTVRRKLQEYNRRQEAPLAPARRLAEPLPLPAPKPADLKEFDLFSFAGIPESGANVEKSVDELPERLGREVNGYLKEGVTSARIICELLIQHHQASNKRLSTGKPDIFIAVCRWIEGEAAKGKCRLDFISPDRSDRQYSWLD